MQTLQVILSICGGISIIGGAWAVIVKIITPAINVNKRVVELEQKVNGVCQTLSDIEKISNANCRAMLALLNHSIDGNGVEYMKEIRNELQTMLINR